ncbi:MAG: type I-A CRISPR-associated protein Cas4/Csa1 [Candidatus Nitrosocaldaceae archaeon]|nr:MAG: type I-A CRISPR-associated protein Cas4/Csa1 [Candidatus Nitrosocaldaceae archaeon]
MYYLSEDERREAERLARSLDIDEEFRGWSYHEGPLKPPYDVKIPIYIISSNMQFRSKEEYESIIKLNRTNPRKEMVLGMLLHKTMYLVVKEAKEFVYSHKEVSGNELYNYLIDVRRKNLSNMIDSLQGLARVYGNEFLHYLNRLWYFESLQISANIDRINSHDRYDPDMLIAKAIPFALEYKIDGSKIGLSENLSIDAFGKLVIFELKTGKMKDYHKLAIAGYALALESILEHPINVGCLVYVSFDEGIVPKIRRYVLPIEEALRRWFIEERDKVMEILALG